MIEARDKIRVLLVEDDEDDYLITRDLLGEIDTSAYELDWAPTYEIAQRMMENDRHDICLLDYRLGAHNGLELLRDAIANDYRAPVILLTGQEDREIDLAAMQSGAADYLVKGRLSADLLERSIRYSLADRRAEQERIQLLVEREARVQAENANRLKDEFLATISHELRTPLNAIVGWAHLLKRRNLDEEATVRGVEIIARNAQAQNQLISDLLDVSRIISGNLRFEESEVDLVPLIDSAVESLRPAAEASGVALRLTLDPEVGAVSGDAARIQQIVWNLLTNAIKFTPTNGLIEVRLKREGANALIIVTDSGQGISPDFLPHIFDRFSQAESNTTRQHGGLGLGLAIVRHLVEAHRGTIRASSAGVGRGATFTVALPLIMVRGSKIVLGHDDAEREFRSATAPSSLLVGLRVLVVDDEADARELLTMILSQSGAEVRVADSARAALAQLDQWRPDVLVSDIGMPGEDGYDLMKKVRALGPARGGTIPALALTGYASLQDSRRSRENGYQAHLTKPVAPHRLIASVANLTGRSGTPGSAERD